MLYRIFSKIPLSFSETARDLMISSARGLMSTVSGIYLGFAYLMFILKPAPLTFQLLPVTALVIGSLALSLFLLKRNYNLANVSWLCGSLAAIFIAILIFRMPEILLCLVLFPLFAVLTMGGSTGILVEAVILGIIFGLKGAGLFSNGSWILPYTIAFVGSLTTLLVSWISLRSLMTILNWTIYNYEEGRIRLKEALDQRVELRQAQDDLIHANRELALLSERLKVMTYLAEDARRVKEEFVAKVSHELRTPLNMIIGFCEMISQSPRTYGGKLPALLLSDIAAIQRNSQHLAGLVNDVLDLSQVEAGKLALSKQWFSIQEVIGEAVEAVQALFYTKKLTLTRDIPAQPINLFADHLRVREVILNLLSNAARFTEQGGVRIRCWERDNSLIVCVDDTGPGIAPEDQKRVFEPFQQLDNSIHRRYGGSGLGLTISKQLIDMHQGKMWLESDLGKGTAIFFSLPLQHHVETQETTNTHPLRWVNPYKTYEEQTRRSKAPYPDLRPLYIILESGEMLQRYFQRYLDHVECVPTRTIEETLEYLEKSPAQAIIVNRPEPISLSNEADRKLLSNQFNIPVMQCWVPGSDDAARKLGVVQYLTKPLSRNKILSAVKSIPGKPKNILLVDDNLEELQLFIRILSSGDDAYTVIRAMHGKQALSMLRERAIDLMILDLVMDGMDGFHVLQEKDRDSTTRAIPVIILSSLDPTGGSVASSSLTLMKNGGISMKQLVNSVQALSQTLVPFTDQYSPEQREGSSA